MAWVRISSSEAPIRPDWISSSGSAFSFGKSAAISRTSLDLASRRSCSKASPWFSRPTASIFTPWM